MTMVLVLLIVLGVVGAVVHLEHTRRAEERDARAHHRALMRELGRHRGH